MVSVCGTWLKGRSLVRMVSAGFKSSFRFAPQSKTRTYLLNDSVESASQLSVLRQHAQKGVFHHSDVGGKNKGRGRHFLE